jgi:DNA-binding response OmpR family regulator
VDDDPDIRQGMHVRLRANHYDTFFAADADEAIAEARKRKPDLIILDLGLTAGNGFMVMERLKHVLFLAVIPIIVVSARDLNPSRARALEAGARAFLQKPVDDGEFLSAIRQALGETEQRRKPTRYDDEFRSALACICQFGNILMGCRAGELSEDQRQYLGIMLENASHIRNMLDGLLGSTPAGLGEGAGTKCADKNGPLSTEAT